MTRRKTAAAAEPVSTANVAGQAGQWFNAVTGRNITPEQAARFTVDVALLGLQSASMSAATRASMVERCAENCGMPDLTRTEHELFVALFALAAEKLT
ncbi:hypothetical protein [Ralstonia sp.]|uniref:hypothetical protein n=1 Tax=Ralstonia sp. TaxID=54061 RepID=UPI00258039FF|nr:hypothetical protein [Ralstonia sp.]MBA4203227.1 hypothetical protein [Ralstonia sp.]